MAFDLSATESELEYLRRRVAELEAEREKTAAFGSVERLLRAAIANSASPIFLKDRSSRYILANSATARAFGLEHSNEVEGKLDSQLTTRDRAADLVAADQRVIQNGRSETLEEYVETSTGDLHVFLTTKVPWRDDRGRIIGVQGSSLDITDRKRTEAALAEAEHNWRTILESISDGFFAINRGWRVTYMNRAAERILELNANEILGKLFWDIFPGLIGSPFEPLYRRAMTEDVGGSIVAWYADHRRYYEVSVYPYAGGISLYFRDVTEQERASQALRTTNQRLELAQDATGVGIFDWDLITNQSTVSAEWRRIYGYPEGAPMPTLTDWVNMIHPLDRERAAAHAEEAMRTGAAYQDEFRVISPDGTARWVERRAHVERDETGKSIRFIGTTLDITARHLAEQALARQLSLTRAITDNATTALFIVDETQHCVFMNPAAEKLTGYSCDEMKGLSFHELVHHTRPDGSPYPAEECPIERAFPENRQAQGEDAFVHRDGHFYEVAFSASPMREQSGILGTVIEVKDITERRRQETERQRVENLLEAVLDALPVGIIIADHNGTFVRLNRATHRIWGDGGSASRGISNDHELVGYRPSTNERLQPADWPLARAVLKGEATKDQLIEIERFDDHRRVMLELSAAPVLDDNGKILGGVVALMDVDERVRAEQGLRASEATLSAVLEALPVGVFIADANGAIVRDNAAHRELWHAPPPTTRWQAYSDWIGYRPETGARISAQDWAMSRALLTGEVVKGELVELEQFETQQRRFFLSNAAPVRNNEGTVIAGVAAQMDVTDRMRAEEAVRASEEQFRTLANAIPQLCWMARPDGDIFWYNQRWYDYTGTRPDEMEGAGWKKVHDPDVLPVVMERWTAALATGEPLDMVFPLRGADGIFRQFLTLVMPVRDVTGRVTRWFGTNTDISDQKRTEAELRRANSDLEQFAFLASHDLQEPLRNIAIFSQILSRQYGPALDANAHEFLGYLTEGAQRISQLVSDLLAYTQAASLRDESVVPSSTEEVLKQVLHELQPAIKETCAVICYETLPVLTVRPIHLQQLFQNLISNAMKYRKDDEAPCVEISAEQLDSMWQLSVRDNGIGIPSEYHTRIFGIFKRLHNRTLRYPGTGIGLAICQKIVQRYGGDIWVESVPGKGATFHFTLPSVTENY